MMICDGHIGRNPGLSILPLDQVFVSLGSNGKAVASISLYGRELPVTDIRGFRLQGVPAEHEWWEMRQWRMREVVGR